MADGAEIAETNPFSLTGLALARFREAFGEPGMSAGHDYQWRVKTAPFGNDIHVLINVQDEQPIVWIFDPNDRADGVNRSIVEREDEIADVVDHIRDRVARASRIMRKPAQSKED